MCGLEVQPWCRNVPLILLILCSFLRCWWTGWMQLGWSFSWFKLGLCGTRETCRAWRTDEGSTLAKQKSSRLPWRLQKGAKAFDYFSSSTMWTTMAASSTESVQAQFWRSCFFESAMFRLWSNNPECTRRSDGWNVSEGTFCAKQWIGGSIGVSKSSYLCHGSWVFRDCTWRWQCYNDENHIKCLFPQFITWTYLWGYLVLS